MRLQSDTSNKDDQSRVRYRNDGNLALIEVCGLDTAANIIEPATIGKVSQLLSRFDDDPNLRVAVMSGLDPPDPVEENSKVSITELPPDGSNALDPIYRPVKPVVAAINGRCIEAGLILVGAVTDIRVAGRSATFGFGAELRSCLVGAAIRSRLNKQIPYVTLTWMALAGQECDAQEALRVGLINEIVADQEVWPRALAIAKQVAELALAPRAEKETLIGMEQAHYDDAVFYGSAVGLLNKLGSDAREVIAALNEKRSPEFRGR